MQVNALSPSTTPQGSPPASRAAALPLYRGPAACACPSARRLDASPPPPRPFSPRPSPPRPLRPAPSSTPHPLRYGVAESRPGRPPLAPRRRSPPPPSPPPVACPSLLAECQLRDSSDVGRGGAQSPFSDPTDLHVLGRLERRRPHARQRLLPAVFAAFLGDVELRLEVLPLDELDVHEARLRLRGALLDTTSSDLSCSSNHSRAALASDILALSFQRRWPQRSLWKGGSG